VANPAADKSTLRHHIKVLVLTSETAANVWLVNRLLAEFEVVGIVIERQARAVTKQEKDARRRRMIQRHGLGRTLNKLLYNWFRSRVLAASSEQAIRNEFFPGDAEVKYVGSVESVIVGNINDPACVEFIKRQDPDVLAVCGTTVIRQEVFSLAPRGAVNIHTGITPDYRSADPIFWALYCNEPEKVGVTIHFVDKGIDTGPIIQQERVPVYGGDTLATLYVRCIRRGAELFLRALAEIESRSVQTVDRSSARSRAFHSIDLGILQFLAFQWRFRKLSVRLPSQPQTGAVQAWGKKE
jgi:methionyl-tRNA formyltransferase